MLDMKLVWWEFIVRAVIVYVALLVMVRVSGKRTVGQFSPFDLLVILMLGQAVAGSLTAGDESVVGGLIAAVTLLLMSALLDFVTSRSKTAEYVFEGTEVLLGRHGRLFDDVMRANRVARSEIDHALRMSDINLQEMDYAILEANGTITVGKNRPEMDPHLQQESDKRVGTQGDA